MKTEKEIKDLINEWQKVHDNYESYDDLVSTEVKNQAKRIIKYLNWVLN